MWFIGFEVEQETSAPPPKKDPGSAPVLRWFREGLWDTYFSFRKGLVSLYDVIYHIPHLIIRPDLHGYQHCDGRISRVLLWAKLQNDKEKRKRT